MTICQNIGRFLRPALIALLLTAVPLAASAQSSDVAAQVAQQLGKQGYRQIEVRRSLLGKVVISARGNGHTREIVVDPRNGDLLRDLVRDEDGRSGSVVASVGTREDQSNDDRSAGNADDSDNSGKSDDSEDNDHADDSGSDDSDDHSGGGSDDSEDDDGSDDSSDSDSDDD